MAMEPTIKRLVSRIAQENKERFRDDFGNLDKNGLTSFILDEFERVHEDAFDCLEEEGARFFVWETIREIGRGTRSGMKAQKAEDGQLALPGLEEVARTELTVPGVGGRSDNKLAIDCTLWELEVIAAYYEEQADVLMQHREFVLALAAHMREQGFVAGATVRDLYRKSA